LRELGCVEGQNIVIVYRWAEGQYERLPILVAELLDEKVEVIVTAGTPATQAVKKATTLVPLVMVAVGDPVATGIVAALGGPVGTSPGSPRSQRTWRGSGWSFSGRCSLPFRESPCSGIRIIKVSWPR
jgi:hypothetical protein